MQSFFKFYQVSNITRGGILSLESLIHNGQFWYLLSTNLAAIILFFVLRKKITKVEDRRIEELEDLDQFEAVDTETPKSKPVILARKRALKSIDSRFTIIKRIFVLGLFFFWSFAMIIPFLGTISASFLSLIITATSVILGIAARPYIENIISGIVISFSRQLNTGDTILIDSQYGTIEDITLTYTIIKIWDWTRYIIPNSEMLKKEFINYSLYDDYQWAYISFWVSHDENIDKVEEIAVSAADSHPFFLKSEKPRFWVMNSQPQGIECWVAAWTNYYEAWTMKSEVKHDIIMRFKNAGITSHNFNIKTTKSGKTKL